MRIALVGLIYCGQLAKHVSCYHPKLLETVFVKSTLITSKEGAELIFRIPVALLLTGNYNP